jgi:hypothetical protein
MAGGAWWAIPFPLLFSAGYLYVVGLAVFAGSRSAPRELEAAAGG